MIAWPLLQAMQHDIVSFGNVTFELNTFSGVLLCHPDKIFEKCVPAVLSLSYEQNITHAALGLAANLIIFPLR